MSITGNVYVREGIELEDALDLAKKFVDSGATIHPNKAGRWITFSAKSKTAKARMLKELYLILEAAFEYQTMISKKERASDDNETL